MNLQNKKEIEQQYDAAFGGGLENLAITELFWEDHFWDLVRRAVARGKPLTRQEVEREFPHASWEE